jgi:hypothetical protein
MTRVETSYLGYPLVITETRVTVRTKDVVGGSVMRRR